MNELPEKLYVEVTTRCNLRCAMCVKQAPESHISDEDMPFSTFERLVPALSRCTTLVLNGIGEPLLHPRLADMVALARQTMPAHGSIGFQTNGVLLTRSRLENLLDAGLDRVCFSVDSLMENDDHGASQAAAVLERIRFTREVMANRGSTGPVPLQVGCEIVVHAGNIAELPELVDCVGRLGVDFCLVSHLLPYARQDADRALFVYDTEEARAFVRENLSEIEANGLDLRDYPPLRMKFGRTPEEDALLAYGMGLLDEAMRRGHPLHLSRMLTPLRMEPEAMEAVFAEARRRAEALGVDLRLPRTCAAVQRQCPFLEGDWAFVNASGSLHPCHFLWHKFGCWPDAGHKTVWPVAFGHLHEEGLARSWSGELWRDFRETARRYDFADCFSCHGVCSDVRGDFGPFTHDCYGATVPCCHCPWGLGGFQCLT